MRMQLNSVGIIILSAGRGTRMKSDKAKVLHKINDKPMILRVAQTAKNVAGDCIVFVIGHQAEQVKKTVSDFGDFIFAYQHEQLGTGHAVSCALPFLPDYVNDVVILSGDVPLLTSETIFRLIKDHKSAKRDLSLLAVNVDNPEGYGRVFYDENMNVTSIVEEADANIEQKSVKTVNSGIYCVDKELLSSSLKKIDSDNSQKEYYLTDIIQIGYFEGKKVGALVSDDYEEVVGVNSLNDLKKAECILANGIK